LPEGLEETEANWRRFLVTLIVERDALLSLAHEAEEDMRRTAITDLPSEESTDASETASSAAKAVRRAVWKNLGSAVRTVLSSLEDTDESVGQHQAARGDFSQASTQDHCTDVAGLAAAIHEAWAVAACEPEDLWAAQLLLGECRRLFPSEAARTVEAFA